MLKLNDQLITKRDLPISTSCRSSEIEEDNANFIDQLIQARGKLPAEPPFEIHPYKADFPLQQFDKYIIGTFPPISYVLDDFRLINAKITALFQPNSGKTISAPSIPFYHGNMGSMWDFVLTNEEISALEAIQAGHNGRNTAKDFLIRFLMRSQINYADVIDSTQRELDKNGSYSGEDANLYNICPNNDLLHHLFSNPNAKFLLFNTASIFGSQGIKTENNGYLDTKNNTKSFDLFVRQCQELGLKVHVQIPFGETRNRFQWTHIHLLSPLDRKTKFIFEMKITNPERNQEHIYGLKPGEEKIFTTITPFSPAAVNRGKTKQNAAVAKWLLKNSEQLPFHLLKNTYQCFRKNDVDSLYELNI